MKTARKRLGDIKTEVPKLSRLVARILFATDVYPRRWCEVGVAEGFTSQMILRCFDVDVAVLIDTWRPYANVAERPEPPINWFDRSRGRTVEKHDEFMRAAMERMRPFGDKAVVVRADSEQIGRLLQLSLFDVVFVDADHMYETTKRDIETYWPTVKPGGLFIGHDYGAMADKYGYWGVKKAADEFFGSERITLADRHLWWVRK